MTRVFTKDIGRWKVGDIREYPFATWQQIEKGNRQTLSSFSKELTEAAKGIVKPIQRTMNAKTT